MTIHPTDASTDPVLDAMLTESREEWQTVRDGLSAIARHRAVLDGAHGATDGNRATHAWVRGDGMTPDGAPAIVPAPDPFSGQMATMRRGRNKRGTTARVIHVGRAFVAGPDPAGVRDCAGRVASVRLDAVTLAAWADVLLAQSLPEDETLASAGLSLVGAVQGRSWEQMVRADGSREAATLAQHVTDLGGGFFDTRRVVLTTAQRADHRYVPAHTPELGNTLADATAQRTHGAPRKVRTFGISRLRRDGAPLIPGKVSARAGDADVAERDVVDKRGKVRTVRTLTGVTPDGRLVTYGDRDVLRRDVLDASRPGRTRTVISTLPPERCAVGFEWRDRPRASTSRRSVAQLRDAQRADERRQRTVAISAVGNGPVVLAAWDGAACEQRVTVPLPAGGTLTFTRRDGAPVKYRYVRADGAAHAFTARTPRAAVVRLATIG